MKSTLQHVLSLSMPVGLVFSHSFLGDDAFMVALQQDCRRHKLHWQESFSQPGLSETSLSSADLRVIEELKRDGLLRMIPLGDDGRAYELLERPFAEYAGPVLQHARQVRLSRMPVSAESVG